MDLAAWIAWGLLAWFWVGFGVALVIGEMVHRDTDDRP